MSYLKVLDAELRKLRHSKVTWATWMGYSLICLMVGFLLWIIKNPGMASRLGLIGQKANFAAGSGGADWPSFAAFLIQMSGIGGILLSSIIVSFVFGREYAEGTAKTMLCLPLRRAWFVAAKLTVSALWFLVLSASLLAESLLVGAFIGLPGFSLPLFLDTCAQVLIVAAALLALAPAVAWLALASEGFMAPMGFTIFMLVVGTILGHTEWSRYFPWSIVPLVTGIAGPRVEHLGTGSYAVLAATFAACLAGAIIHQQRADNTQ